MNQDVEAFYDRFAAKFVEDIAGGNARIEQQLIFLSRTIPTSIRSVLVIGSGSGQAAHYIATRLAKEARLLAIDISDANLRLAHAVFDHPRIEYRKVDVTCDPLEGEWEVILMPDVYEHIPKASRGLLHKKLDRALSQNGKILFTVPSPGKQASLYATGKGLQIVDEVVTLEDLNQVARDVGGLLTYFNMISVWETNDYIHAVVERGAAQVKPIGEKDTIPIKGWLPKSVWSKGREFLGYRCGLYNLRQNWRRRRILRKLARTNSDANR
jgi:SAM-dependent methyltransferase